MIEKLEQWQIDLMPEYVDKWMKIGLCCDPLDFDEAKKWACVAYKAAGLEPPKMFFSFDSPLSAAIGGVFIDQIFNHFNDKARVKAWEKVHDQVWDKVLDQVLEQAFEQVGKKVHDQVWEKVREKVRKQVDEQVREKVFDQVREKFREKFREQVGDKLREKVWSQLWGQIYGSHDASWICFYDYMREVVGVTGLDAISGLVGLSKCCGWLAPKRGIVIFQNRHEKVSFNKNGLLHCDGGPAVRYRDGFSVWALNGVNVPQWLAESKADEIDPMDIYKLKNAQQRAEAIKKVGIERWVYKADAKTIDKQGDYELLSVKWFDGSRKKYLKMLNPSVPELWHIEGVGNEVNTVDEAHVFRIPKRFKHLKLSADGECWYQQGDQYIIPKGAKSIKPRPERLT